MKEPLLLIHGVGGDSSNWDEIVPQLEPRFGVIRVDLPGHGRSAPIRSPVTVFDLARRVAEMMDVASAHVAGFSLGGQGAQALALEHPQRVRSVALISTVAGGTQAERAGALSRIGPAKGKSLGATPRLNRAPSVHPAVQRRR